MKIESWEIELSSDGRQVKTIRNPESHFELTSSAEWQPMIDLVNRDLSAGRVVNDPPRWGQKLELPGTPARQTSYLAEAWTSAQLRETDAQWLARLAELPHVRPA